MRVMQESEQRRPRIRRLADQLGAMYTPLAVAIAVGGMGDQRRGGSLFGGAGRSHALSAVDCDSRGHYRQHFAGCRAGIIVRDPAVLEQIDTCRTVIFDKTGTLTYGEPRLIEQLVSPDFNAARCADAGRQLGAIFEASAGRGDIAGSRARTPSSQRGRGDSRKTGRRAARNSCGPSSANHQPKQTCHA